MTASAKTSISLVAGLIFITTTVSAATIPAVESLKAPEKSITLNYFGGAIPAERANKIISAF